MLICISNANFENLKSHRVTRHALFESYIQQSESNIMHLLVQEETNQSKVAAQEAPAEKCRPSFFAC